MWPDNDTADSYGYYHWHCNECGESGWTDTSPDCACREPEVDEDGDEAEKTA